MSSGSAINLRQTCTTVIMLYTFLGDCCTRELENFAIPEKFYAQR